MRTPIADRLRSILPVSVGTGSATSSGPVAAGGITPAARLTSTSRRPLVTEHRWAPSDTFAGERIESLASRIVEGQTGTVLLTRAMAPPPFLFFDLETTGLAG